MNESELYKELGILTKSGSKILIFDDLALKITDKSSDDRDAVEMMRWLEGKLPVPKVISYVEDDHHRYLLMAGFSITD